MSRSAIYYLRGLSAEQSEAAHVTSDPVMIIAGAGSGKTRTLAGRFIHLTLPEALGGLGADSSSVMMVTFTNKAAREMRERIKPLIDDMTEANPGMRKGEPWIGTFHGISLRILRIEAARAGLGSNFSIFDESDASNLAGEVAEQIGLNGFDVDEFFRDIETAKARLLGADILNDKNDEIVAAEAAGQKLNGFQARWKREIAQFQSVGFLKMYKAYQKSLDDQNAVDFSDLMNRVTTLFTEHPDIRDSWRSSFRHFMVDEVQDINRAQVAWLQAMTDGGRPTKIAKNAMTTEFGEATDGSHEVNTFRIRKFPRPTIAFVGDDDQSIYGFRGSERAVLKLLERKFEGTQVKFLTETYRCQPSIIASANTLIKHNSDRYEKSIAAADKGRMVSPVTISQFFNGKDEIAAIIKNAKAHIASGESPSEFAVLARTRDISRQIAREIRAAGLPVTEGKASDIRKTMEVRDAMSFCGFIANPEAETLLRRIINKPSRGLGATSMATVGINAKSKGITFMEEMRTIMNNKVDLPEGAKGYGKAFVKNVREFDQLMTSIRGSAKAAENASDAIFAILEETGYLKDLKHKALTSAGIEPADGVMEMKPREFLTWLIDEDTNQGGKTVSSRPAQADIRDRAEEGEDIMEHEDLADRAGQMSETGRRIGNLSVLMAQAEKFESLEDFMQDATLEMDQSEAVAGIQVMTLHGSKGLEFDHVYLPFWIKGVMPHSNSENDGPEGLEEERRLAYVGMTRARHSVNISHAKNVRDCPFIRVRFVDESPFIKEIKRGQKYDFLHRTESFGKFKSMAGGYGYPSGFNTTVKWTNTVPGTEENLRPAPVPRGRSTEPSPYSEADSPFGEIGDTPNYTAPVSDLPFEEDPMAGQDPFAGYNFDEDMPMDGPGMDAGYDGHDMDLYAEYDVPADDGPPQQSEQKPARSSFADHMAEAGNLYDNDFRGGGYVRPQSKTVEEEPQGADMDVPF